MDKKVKMFKLVLVDLQGELCQEFEKAFHGLDNVEIVHGRFEDVDFDCVVSAANSFGLMDGGVDGAITMYFGEQLMRRVQDVIIEHYHGEQPVGTSFIIRANKEPKEVGNKYVAHTPTMRVPKDIRATENVYQAMKAMLIAVNQHNKLAEEQWMPNTHSRIETVACVGLGTFCGQMPFDRAAREMRLAYDNFMNPPQHIDWDFAVKRNNEVFRVKTS